MDFCLLMVVWYTIKFINILILIGGLKRSSMIDSHIIDHFVPFLPLEKMHVVQCIEAELKNLKRPLDSKITR